LDQRFHAAALLVESLIYASDFARRKFSPRSLRCLHSTGLRCGSERSKKIVRTLRKS